MLTTIRNRVKYSRDSSQAIGRAAAQQRLAYNHAVNYTLAHPNVSKKDLQAQLTSWRNQDPQRWTANVAIQRPGLFRGREAVRKFDSASLKTLRECQKEIKLRDKPSPKRKPPKHPVRPGRNLNAQRLFLKRKRPSWLIIEDSSTIRVIDPKTIRAAGLTIALVKPIDPHTDVRTVQIMERESSRKQGRNRPLHRRNYEVNLVINVPDPEQKSPWDNPTGLDAGKVNTLTDSQGRTFRHPESELKPHADNINDLRERQKRLKRGGRQWTKLQKAIRRERKAQRGILQNWENQTAKKLATEHSLIAVEDLKLRNMTRSAKGTPENPGRNVQAKSGLNRSMLGVRIGSLHSKLERQCEKNGAWFARVPPEGTSQTCPFCGFKNRQNRKSQADFACLRCFTHAHADTVAAINILALALTALALLTLLWAHGPDREAVKTRRRPGLPPLNDSLTLIAGRPKTGRPGPKRLGISCEEEPAPRAPAFRPMPFEPKLSL